MREKVEVLLAMTGKSKRGLSVNRVSQDFIVQDIAHQLVESQNERKASIHASTLRGGTKASCRRPLGDGTAASSGVGSRRTAG